MKENLSFFPLETGYMLHFVIDFKEHGMWKLEKPLQNSNFKIQEKLEN